ncbi:MAG: glycosyltransferase family 39 protein [Chloroflexota bacterium]
MRVEVKEATPKRVYIYLIGILLLGLIIRLVWLLLDPHAITSDEVAYHNLATSLAQGNEYGLPFWPPGYPISLAMLYRLFGASADVAIGFNLVLSMCTLLVVFLAAKKIFSIQIAIFATLIMAFMPSYILVISLVRYEVLLQFCLVLALLLSLYQWRAGNMLAIALLTAVASLMRPLMIFWPFMLWLTYPKPESLKSRAKKMVLVQGLSICFILPWIIYASLSAGRFVPVALNGGINLWIGNNPEATGAYIAPPGEYWNPQNEDLASQEALTYMVNNPAKVVSLFPYKIAYSLDREHWVVDWIFLETETGMSTLSYELLVYLSDGYYIVMSGLAILSVLWMWRKKSYGQLLLLLLVAYSIAGQLPFFGSPRFRWITQFVLIFYAAVSVALIWDQIRLWSIRRFRTTELIGHE